MGYKSEPTIPKRKLLNVAKNMYRDYREAAQAAEMKKMVHAMNELDYF